MMTWFLVGACVFLVCIIGILLVAINNMTGLISDGAKTWLKTWSR